MLIPVIFDWYNLYIDGVWVDSKFVGHPRPIGRIARWRRMPLMNITCFVTRDSRNPRSTYGAAYCHSHASAAFLKAGDCRKGWFHDTWVILIKPFHLLSTLRRSVIRWRKHTRILHSSCFSSRCALSSRSQASLRTVMPITYETILLRFRVHMRKARRIRFALFDDWLHAVKGEAVSRGFSLWYFVFTFAFAEVSF